MQCPNCQTKLSKGANFCSACGTSAIAAREAAVIQDVQTVETGGGVVGALQGDGTQIGGKRHDGDIVNGDKVDGDKVGRDKIVNTYISPSSITPPALDDATALSHYLNHIIESNRRLPLQGIRSAGGLVSVELEQIYVTLTATVRKAVAAEESMLAEMAWLAPGEAKRHGLEYSRPIEQQVKVDVQEALGLHRRLVVLGDPGSGKTTLLRYLALTHARDLAEGNGFVRQRLSLEESRLPVLIMLRDFARFLEKEHPNEGTDGPKLLLDYLHEYFANQNLPLLADFLAKRLKAGECAVLLDGVDEVADLNTRRRVARIIESFVRNYPDNRYVVTSRIVGYIGGARLGEGFDVTTVRDFTDNDIERFGTFWNHAVEVSLAGEETPYVLREAERQKRKLLAAIHAKERIRELAVNPLLLTVIALVQRYRARLPERRTELYEEAKKYCWCNGTSSRSYRRLQLYRGWSWTPSTGAVFWNLWRSG